MNSQSGLSVDTLLIGDVNQADEKITAHLANENYCVFLVPDWMPVINGVRERHFGKVLKYGMTPFHSALNTQYDGYLDLSAALECHLLVNAIKMHIE